MTGEQVEPHASRHLADVKAQWSARYSGITVVEVAFLTPGLAVTLLLIAQCLVGER